MQRHLRAGDRGAISLIAVFFAVFALAMLYSLIGTAQAIAFREGLQDHADKAALSSAVLHARSMNLIVLINLVMAGLLAILVALKLVEGLAILGILIAAGLAWLTAGASLAWVPPLKVVRDSVSSTYDTAKPPIYQALEVLHQMSDTVRDVAPMVASAASLSDPDATGLRGFAASTRATEGLPVIDDDFDHLCEKSGELAVNLWATPFAKSTGIPIDQIGLDGAVGGLTGQLSDWFCGDSSSGPPSYRHTTKKSYPDTDADAACRDGEADERTCAEREAFWRAAEPDGSTGSCQAGQDCSPTGPYETNAALAREQCDPARSPRPFRYFYQLRHGHADYEWDGDRWRLLQRRYDVPRRVDTETAPGLPCGSQSQHPVVAVGYNKTVRKSSDVNELLPVCSTEIPPLIFPGQKPRKGETRTIEFDEVTHILGCVAKVEQIVDFDDDDESGGSGGESKAPKTVPNDLKLGDERLQIRSFAHQDASMLDAARIVRLALWDRPAPDDPLAPLRRYSEVAFAQAEYFYDGGGDAGEAWMWNMNWRARLVRFRLPAEMKDVGVLAGLCVEMDAGCLELLPKLKQLELVIAH
jgi:hypothetical protein